MGVCMSELLCVCVCPSVCVRVPGCVHLCVGCVRKQLRIKCQAHAIHCLTKKKKQISENKCPRPKLMIIGFNWKQFGWTTSLFRSCGFSIGYLIIWLPGAIYWKGFCLNTGYLTFTESSETNYWCLVQKYLITYLISIVCLTGMLLRIAKRCTKTFFQRINKEKTIEWFLKHDKPRRKLSRAELATIQLDSNSWNFLSLN